MLQNQAEIFTFSFAVFVLLLSGQLLANKLPDDRNNAAIIKETSFSMSFSLNNVNLSNNSVNVNEVHFENIGNVAPQPNSQDNTSLMSWLIILTIMVTIIGVTAVFVVLKIRERLHIMLRRNSPRPGQQRRPLPPQPLVLQQQAPAEDLIPNDNDADGVNYAELNFQNHHNDELPDVVPVAGEGPPQIRPRH